MGIPRARVLVQFDGLVPVNRFTGYSVPGSQYNLLQHVSHEGCVVYDENVSHDV